MQLLKYFRLAASYVAGFVGFVAALFALSEKLTIKNDFLVVLSSSAVALIFFCLVLLGLGYVYHSVLMARARNIADSYKNALNSSVSIGDEEAVTGLIRLLDDVVTLYYTRFGLKVSASIKVVVSSESDHARIITIARDTATKPKMLKIDEVIRAYELDRIDNNTHFKALFEGGDWTIFSKSAEKQFLTAERKASSLLAYKTPSPRHSFVAIPITGSSNSEISNRIIGILTVSSTHRKVFNTGEVFEIAQIFALLSTEPLLKLLTTIGADRT